MQMPMECAVQHVLTVYMSSMAGIFYEAGSDYSFDGVRFAHCLVFFVLSEYVSLRS
jgi:hypothetical protein